MTTAGMNLASRFISRNEQQNFLSKTPEFLPRKWEQTYRFNDSDAASL